MATDSCRPRLYVYRLPEAYRNRLFAERARDIGEPVSQNWAEFPDVQLWNSAMYGLGDLFHSRALSYRCRTFDAAQADLFFLPAYTQDIDSRKNCAEAPGARLRRLQAVRVGNVSALERRGGTDHVLLNPRPGGHFESAVGCELDYLRSLFLGKPTLLSIVQAIGASTPWPYDWQPGQPYTSIPFPSVVHASSADVAAATHWPWEKPRRQRRTLVAACFGHQAGLRTAGQAVPRLRARLAADCAALPNECTNGTDSAYMAAVTASSLERTLRAYWDATFCLQPPGDDLMRKGIVDALLLGCIPVLFHPGQRMQWPWHFGSWVANATVLLEWRAIIDNRMDWAAVLRAIPRDEVEAMRTTIAKNAHRMQYSAVDTASLRGSGGLAVFHDAFDEALRGAWRNARDAERSGVVAAGRWRQRMHLRGAGVGYCSFTAPFAGDCTAGSSGAWAFGAFKDVRTLAGCRHRCRACARCKYVSHSTLAKECGWFATCDLGNLKLRDNGEAWLTVAAEADL